MSTTTHPARRRWTRRAVVCLGFFLAAVLGLAAALFTGTAPITGSATSSSFTPVWNSKPQVDNHGGATCTASRNNDTGKVVLHVTNAYPGTSCRVSGTVGFTEQDRPDEDGRIVGVNLSLPPKWTARVVDGCGDTISHSAAGFGTGQRVEIEVTMTDQAAPGSSGTFAPSDGVQVAPVSQDAPLECEPTP